MFEFYAFPKFYLIPFPIYRGCQKYIKGLRFDRTWRAIVNHEWFIPTLIRNGAKEPIWHRMGRMTNYEEVK